MSPGKTPNYHKYNTIWSMMMIQSDIQEDNWTKLQTHVQITEQKQKKETVLLKQLDAKCNHLILDKAS